MIQKGGCRVWIYGGGTALPSSHRDNTFLAVEGNNQACYLIDCGGSPYQRLLQSGLSPLKLRGVVLTHSHTDHIYGLPALLFQLSLAGYRDELPIYGLSETLRLARQVVEAYELGEHCALHQWCPVDLEEGQVDVLIEEEVKVLVGTVQHSQPALGVRIEVGEVGKGGRVYAYSGDTEPCVGLLKLARDADWLLHECTAVHPLPGHSTPEDVGQVALEADAKQLGIVHYDPQYSVSVKELVNRIRGVGYRGKVVVLGNLEEVQ